MYPTPNNTIYRIRTGLPNPSHETKFQGANGDKEISIFPIQLTTNRIGNLTRLILLLLYVMTTHTYITPLGRINASGIE